MSNFYKEEKSEKTVDKKTVDEEVRECLDEIIEKIVALKQEESSDSVSIHSNVSIDSSNRGKISLSGSQNLNLKMFLESKDQDCILKMLAKLFCQK